MGDDLWVFVGFRIKRKRLEAGISVEEVAMLAGITSEDLVLFESDSTGMTPELLIKIGQALGVDFQYFFEEVPKDEAEPEQQGTGSAKSAGPPPPRMQ